MKATYLIEKNSKTVLLNIEGHVKIFDSIKYVKKMYEDLMFEPNFNNFIDLSSARPSITVNVETIKESVDFLKSVEAVVGKCKWAVFAPEDYTYTISLIFEKLFKSDSIDMQIFKNQDRAKKWLNL